MNQPRLLPVFLAAAVLTSCGSGQPTASVTTLPATTAATTTTTAATTTTTAAPATTTTASPSTTSTGGEDTLVIPPVGEMSEAWEEALFVAYGDGEGALGTSPGGDAGSLDLGPEYGAAAGDGTWWFLDAAKLRLAHYTADGDFIDALQVPTEVLTDGVYFQYQLPRVLDDGTLVATGFGDGQSRVLLARGGAVLGTTVPREVGVQADDGRLLYGYAYDGESGPVVVDLEAGATDETEWFLGRGGNRYRITAGGDRLRIELPDASFDRTFDLEAGEIGGAAFVFVEVATGEDGSLHLLLIGFPEADESVQLAGYLRVGGDGALGVVETVRDPFSPSDPGSPAHLGVRPGSSDPWLMFIDEDGVRVYTRLA